MDMLIPVHHLPVPELRQARDDRDEAGGEMSLWPIIAVECAET